VATAEQAVVTPCPFLDPSDPAFYGGPPVLYDHELVITDVSVVDDPCRTSWSGSCGGGGTPGIWTFGELMARMSGTTPPEEFVRHWLHEWEIPLAINGFPVPPRPLIRPLVIDPWLVNSGCPAGSPIVGPGACKLDLKQSPFILLGITNRVDLECADYKGPGIGEARFIFGVLDAGGKPLQAAIILEYKLPPQRGGTPYTGMDWENDWHQLSTVPIGSPTYMKILEKLLDDITAVGAIPGNPNFGSAIGQVRTNEVAFDKGGTWKLRETRLLKGPINGMLLLTDTTAETPDDSMNQSPPLDSYLSGNAGLLAMFQQPPVPVSLLGGESSMPLPGPTPFFDHSAISPLNPDERHHFSLNTCNNCHLAETATNFLHIGVRTAGTPAPLSPFLSTPPIHGGGGLPAFIQSVSDPAPTGAVFQYNEPWRRVCEASRMLAGHGECWARANGAH
jgi:hypothetical protein